MNIRSQTKAKSNPVRKQALNEFSRLFCEGNGCLIKIIYSGSLFSSQNSIPIIVKGSIPNIFSKFYFPINDYIYPDADFYKHIKIKTIPAIEFTAEDQERYYLSHLRYKSDKGFALIDHYGVKLE